MFNTIARLISSKGKASRGKSAPKKPADNTSAPESVYFYTFHKCASTLFAGYVLKQMKGLKHVNYANKIYSGKHTGNLVFKERGQVYGPLRITSGPIAPAYKELAEVTSTPEFVRDKIAIFLVRDPRDILVSSYYSFGFSHGLSPVAELRERQERARAQIQAKTLDEYVMEGAPGIAASFQTLATLHQACNRGVLLKYEEMVNGFDQFLARFTQYVTLNDGVAQEMRIQSRPKQTEDINSHQRSGKVGGFRGKLQPATLDFLAKELEPVLVQFGYEV